MTSLILRMTTRFLFSLLLLFSLFLLLSGHNDPGGGFAGSLVAAAALALHALAYDVASARHALPVQPPTLIGTGLLIAMGSGIFSLLAGQPFMTGKWLAVQVPGLGKVALGTPVLFDVGVYFVVLGVTLLIIFTLAEE
jgi:multicomponent Na+:H+ antiporter subunit B